MVKYVRRNRKRRSTFRRRLRGRSTKKSKSMFKSKGPGLVRSAPFPKTFKFKTKYVETRIALDPGVGGTPSTYVFSMNGLYDPNITGTGHQPIGFDQLMTMYDHYTVIGSRARITLFNRDSTYPQTIIAHLKDDVTVSSDENTLLENGLNRYITVSPQGSAGCNKSLQLNCSPSKFFGKKVLQDDIFRGSIASNPSEQVYLHLTSFPMEGTDTGQVRLTVEIEYTAILTERKELVGS